MINVNDLSKSFGSTRAVDSLTFEVKDGEVFGFLGPNGAGKTTTIRMLCCLISKTSGTAKIGKYEIGKDKDSLKIRKMIGLVPDNVGLYEGLSAYDNLDFYGKLYDMDAKNRTINIEKYLKMLDIWQDKDQLIANYSKGMKQKIAIARALIHEPKILFMDEPTANLDPESSKTVRDFILDLKKQDKTIFLNTHNLDEAQRICDRIGIIKTKLLTVATPQQLMEQNWSKKTIIELEKINKNILHAVKKLNFGKVTNAGNIMEVDVTDPKMQNPKIISAIVAAGGNILMVSQKNPGLEDAYLKIVKEIK